MLLPSLLDAPSEPRLAPPAPPAHRCLLIVDDEEGPRQSLRILFKEEYRLLLASSGAEAIALAREHEVDAAVVDIRMYGMSGIEVLDRLKQIDPATEVIILTAYETLETARQALRLGACDYLTKPFDLGTVRAAIARAMERRTFSEQVQANNQRLQDLHLELANQRLREEIVRNRGDIYGSILHDINGPLTVISGFISMINLQLTNLRWLDAESTRAFKDRLEAVNRHVSNCVDITQRYLGFLRQGSSDTGSVSVNQTLRDVDALLRAHPDAQTHRVSILPLPADAQARVNGTDLIQILLNLTVNALQATAAPHSVEIAACCSPEPLGSAVFREGPFDRFLRHDEFDAAQPNLAIAVRDNGPGMPPEVVQKLFHTHFTSKPPPKGTGLGLSIVKRLVLLSKGALTLHTEPGAGTSFTLYLPLLGSN